MRTRILIADDDPTIRMLLRRLIDENPSFEVCGEASSGSEAVQKAALLAPDLVILDLAMPNMNGIQAAQEISKVYPAIPMLLVSVQEVSTQLVEAAREVGFRGAVTKSRGKEVLEGLAAISRNETYFAVENAAYL
jgi:DNA-binding NarL/FixJ family response regulator